MTETRFYFVGEHAVSQFVYALVGVAQTALLLVGCVFVYKMIKSVITAVQYDRALARSRRDAATVKQLALDSYERAAWAEIAAMQLGEQTPQEFLVTHPEQAIATPIPIQFGTQRIAAATGFLRDSFKELERAELSIMTPELFDFARHRNVEIS